VFDASWHMAGGRAHARAEYLSPYSQRGVFDIDAVADARRPAAHAAGPIAFFRRRMRDLGLGDGMRASFYDSLGLFSAPRLWWTLRAFGSFTRRFWRALPRWIARGGKLQPSAEQAASKVPFTRGSITRFVADAPDVKEGAGRQIGAIADGAGAERFKGQRREPRPGLRSGHMPAL